MTVHGIVCKKCNTFIYSRARHDFNSCPCNACSIDGGQDDYVRIIGNQEDWEGGFEANLGEKVNNRVIYNDWNTGKNKYGKIVLPSKKVTKIVKENTK